MIFNQKVRKMMYYEQKLSATLSSSKGCCIKFIKDSFSNWKHIKLLQKEVRKGICADRMHKMILTLQCLGTKFVILKQQYKQIPGTIKNMSATKIYDLDVT